jgi:hypothetical protein
VNVRHHYTNTRRTANETADVAKGAGILRVSGSEESS